MMFPLDVRIVLSFAMLTIAWPWGMKAVPSDAQIIVFAAAALWYLFRTIRPKNPQPAARVNSSLLVFMSAGMALAFLPF